MTLCNKKAALEQATRIVNYIEKDELTKEEKDLIVKESIANFNENVNPGWLEYRKSVSTDATFVEWTDSVDHFEDLYGNEFIDCLGGFGIFTLSLIHISEPTRRTPISYAVFCLKKKKKNNTK